LIKKRKLVDLAKEEPPSPSSAHPLIPQREEAMKKDLPAAHGQAQPRPFCPETPPSPFQRGGGGKNSAFSKKKEGASRGRKEVITTPREPLEIFLWKRGGEVLYKTTPEKKNDCWPKKRKEKR